MNINEWFAEQCGVQEKMTGWLDTSEYWHQERWDIKDPRCMQVVREKFRLDTESNGDTWSCWYSPHAKFYHGVTIPEAEYACCEAIYEARGE